MLVCQLACSSVNLPARLLTCLLIWLLACLLIWLLTCLLVWQRVCLRVLSTNLFVLKFLMGWDASRVQSWPHLKSKRTNERARIGVVQDSTFTSIYYIK